MNQSLSISLGKFLYKNAFPFYNRLYPIFKRRQDAEELKLIRSFVKPGYTVIDIGANIGFYTRLFSDLVGETGSVHAFEPETINFTHLQNNLNAYKNVKQINKAVSDKTGPLKIYVSKLLNVDHRTYPIDNYERIVEINAITIDEYTALNTISSVQFIKMDIQGFEMSALKGMATTLKNNPDVQLITELWPYGLMKAGSSSLEVYSFLNSLGFNLYLISKTGLQPLTDKSIIKLKVDEQTYYNVVVSKKKFN
jgi:FkbM family methyltransferase